MGLALLELPRTRSAGAASRERGVLFLKNGGASHQTGKDMGKRDWVKSVRKKLPDDIGDCPTLPQEMLDWLAGMRAKKSDRVWGGAPSNLNESGSNRSWRVARAG
jgi:hypothetical protein